METTKIDTKGLRCPQPILIIAARMPALAKGDILEVEADCPQFEAEVRKWCQRTANLLLSINKIGNYQLARIRCGA